MLIYSEKDQQKKNLTMTTTMTIIRGHRGGGSSRDHPLNIFESDLPVGLLQLKVDYLNLLEFYNVKLRKFLEDGEDDDAE